ncbi:MAG: acyl-protein synthetase [Gammaproteobacteria bacterium]
MKLPDDPLDPFIDGVAPFALDPAEKRGFLATRLAALEAHHRAGCAPYARLAGYWPHGGDDIESRLYLPVTLFKEYDLISVDSPVTSVNSSATTGTQHSKVYVDKQTKKRQARSASRILADFIGDQKRPYLVFDTEQTVRGAGGMSARAAAILSLSHFASEVHFVLREDAAGQLVVDFDALEAALDKVGERPFIAYGFTWILYQAHTAIAASGRAVPPARPGSVLLHSGGWKKMTALAVDKAAMNACVAGVWGLPPTAVIDFYGSVEQVGVPYPDCAEGYKHVPYWADVIIRRADDLSPCAPGERGLVQLCNALPLSAPNHNVLTEDLGELVLLDGCSCGRRDKAFLFHGRAPRAEVRGCSDVGAVA